MSLTENVFEFQQNERTLSIRVNQMNNFLKENIEMQGFSITENENLENVTMTFKKLLFPPLQKIGTIRHLRSTKPNTNYKKTI